MRLPLAIVFLLLAPMRVSATPIDVFNNFGPNGEYGGSEGTNISWGLHGGGLPRREHPLLLAVGFIPSASMTLDTVSFAAHRGEDSSALNLTAWLSPDRPGSFGPNDEILESFRFTGIAALDQAQATGPLIGTSQSHPTLTAGHLYWFVVRADFQQTGGWFTNGVGQVAYQYSALSLSGSPGSWQGHATGPTDLTPVLHIAGTRTGTETEPIPEPSTLALFSVGCTALRRHRARTR